GGARAQKNNHALADRELRRADHDALETTHAPSRHAELQRGPERPFQVRVRLQRHDRFDRAVIVGPLRVEPDHLASDNRPRLARELAKTGWLKRRRSCGGVGCKDQGTCENQRLHHYFTPMTDSTATAARRLAPGPPNRSRTRARPSRMRCARLGSVSIDTASSATAFGVNPA